MTLTESKFRVGHQRHGLHYLSVLIRANDLLLKGGDGYREALALFDVNSRNIEAAQHWAASQNPQDVASSELVINYAAAAKQVLSLRQRPRDTIKWQAIALLAARRFRVRSREGVLLNTLGVAYSDLGQARRAILCHRQALNIAREIGDRHSEASALGNLGIDYSDLGQNRRAIEFYDRQLAIMKEMGNGRAEGIALGNLGLAYAALGDLQKAIEYHQQHLALSRKIAHVSRNEPAGPTNGAAPRS